MSFRRYSKNELGWYKAGYGLIASRLQREIRNAYTDDGTLRSHWKAEVRSYNMLRWRLGLNLYRSGQYEQAISTLTALCAILDDAPALAREQGISEVSFIHQVVAQCAVQQFLQTYDHSRLELAYEHYQIAVDHLQANLVAMFKLPSLLVEFGRTLEYYGSLEAALEVYSQVLTKFPNFHGYFDALYRTAVVAYHLASTTNSDEERSSAIDKCTDIFQFLLEALPANIQASHIIFLYARVLEASTNPSTRFRATNVLKSLHSYCKERQLADAHKQPDAKIWLALPETWFLLGLEISSFGEFLISREAYTRYISLLRKQVKTGRELSSYLTVDRCVLLAHSCAVMQDMPEAIRYAELGLQIDRYNPDIRALLAKWNSGYQDTLSAEIKAVNKIRLIWKDRIWSMGFVGKLRRQMIAEHEQRLQRNRWDSQARAQLSYYARDVYRPLFVYEEQCILRIQRWFRKLKKEMVWMEVQRHHHAQRAAEVIARLQQNYYHPALRGEALQVVRSKFLPRKHPLHTLVDVIRKENRYISILFHALRVFSFRRKILGRIRAKEHLQLLAYIRKVVMAQKIMRTFLARMRYLRMIALARRQNEAASKIQAFYRRKKMSFRYVVYLLLYSAYRAKTKAMKVLKRRLPSLLARLRQRRKLGYQTLEKQTRRRQERIRRIDSGATKVTAAIKIQRFYLRCSFRYHLHCAVQQLKKRRHVMHNHYHRPRIERALHDRSACYYRNPGVSKSSPEYQWLLSRELVVCDDSLAPVDYLLLGGVLRHPQCRIRCLILAHVTVFQNDVDPLAFQALLGLEQQHHLERTQHVLFDGIGPDRKADLPKHLVALSLTGASSFSSSSSSPRPSPLAVSAEPRTESTLSYPPPLVLQPPPRVEHLPTASPTPSSSNLFSKPVNTPREYYTGTQTDPVSISADERCKLAFFQALTKGLSLSSLVLVGGRYHHNILKHVLACVQVDNPRIQEVVLQDIQCFSVPYHTVAPRQQSAAMDTPSATLHGSVPRPPGHSLLQDVLTSKTHTRSSSSGGQSSPASPRGSPRGLSLGRDRPARDASSPGRGRVRHTAGAAASTAAPSMHTTTLLCQSARLLLLDYFNYSLPGLRVLCLHGCKLGDEHADLLAAGVQVNTSVHALQLSLNLITDKGFVSLFQAMCANAHSRVGLLDLSHNLLQCQDGDMLRLLGQYRHEMHKTLHFVEKRSLVLDLAHNQIVKPFDVLAHAVREHVVPQLEIVYVREDERGAGGKGERRKASHREGQERGPCLQEGEDSVPLVQAAASDPVQRRHWSHDVDPVILRRVGKALGGRGLARLTRTSSTVRPPSTTAVIHSDDHSNSIVVVVIAAYGSSDDEGYVVSGGGGLAASHRARRPAQWERFRDSDGEGSGRSRSLGLSLYHCK